MVTSAQSRLGNAPEEAVKAPVKIHTVGNITLSGLQAINGYTTLANDRVLVRNQTDGTENGIYNAKNGAWVRATDWNADNDVIKGMLILSSESAASTIFRVGGFTGDFDLGTTEPTFTDILAGGVTFIPAGDSGQIQVNISDILGTYANFSYNGNSLSVPQINGVAISGTGSATTYLNGAGGYTTPPDTVTSPGGNSTEVQVNVSGVFTGYSNLTYNGTTLNVPQINGVAIINSGAGDAWLDNSGGYSAPTQVTLNADSATQDTLNISGQEIQVNLATGTSSGAMPTGDKVKIDFIAITQAVDLDALETRVNELDAAVVLQGTWDASSGSFPGGGSAQAGHSYIVSTSGTVDSIEFTSNDRIVALTDNASTSTYASNWHKLDYTDAVLSVEGFTGAVTKAQLAIDNVDNTSDLDKPISTATQAALDLKADDNAVVKLTGDQTAAGEKTWSDDAYFEGEVSIGTHGDPKEFSVGGGDSYETGRKLYTYNGSIYSDESGSSTVSFPNTSVNTAIYVSTTLTEEGSGNQLQFFNVKVGITTAAVGGEIVAEYWDGLSWTEFNHMSYGETGTVNTFQKNIFQRVADEHINFNYQIGDDWATNDDPSSGTNSYWVRFRIATALTTAPAFNLFKVGPSRTEGNENGFITHKGTGRPVGKLPFDVNSFVAAASSPANQDLYFGDNVFKGSEENLFADGVTDRSGTTINLPQDIDTSCPLFVRVIFASDGSGGNIDTELSYAHSRDTDSIYTGTADAPGTAPREQQISEVIAAPASDDEQFSQLYELDISDVVTQSSTGPDLLWLTFARFGGSGTDTHSGDVAMVDVDIDYTKWSLGGFRE